jgi:hypothetical protein
MLRPINRKSEVNMLQYSEVNRNTGRRRRFCWKNYWDRKRVPVEDDVASCDVEILMVCLFENSEEVKLPKSMLIVIIL